MATVDEFKLFLEKVSMEAGLDTLAPSEDGLLQLQAGDIELNLQFIPSANKIFVCTEIGFLPETAPSALYRLLLSEQVMGYHTGGGSFALVKGNDVLVYQIICDFCPSEPAAFAQLLSDVLDFTEKWRGKLSDLLNGQGDVESPAVTPEMQFPFFV